MRINLDTLWARELSTISGSYINLRQNMISWKKLGIDPKILLPVFGPFPIKEDVCGNSVATNMVSKSLNAVGYVGYTQYNSIGNLWNEYANVYG